MLLGSINHAMTFLRPPFGPGGYYAVYFLGPDRLKFEVVHMPLAEQRFRERGDL